MNDITRIVDTVDVDQIAETVGIQPLSLIDIESYLRTAIEYGIRVLLAILFFILGRLIIRWVMKLVRFHMNRTHMDTGLAQFVESFVRGALFVLLIVFIATHIGIEASSVAALIASAGVAIGLALQGSLSNFAGGILILILKPFRVGDYIITTVPGGIEGVVTEIRVFCTRLTTADNRRIVVPNGALSNSSVTNVSVYPTRRLDLNFTLTHAQDYEHAKASIIAILEQEHRVIKDDSIQVCINSIDQSSVTLLIRAWVHATEFAEAKASVLEGLKRLIDQKAFDQL